jgi:hypothetical protein
MDLEVQMRTSRATGAAAEADDLTSFDALADRDQEA